MKARQVNQPTEKELNSANQTCLLEEVETMLETIRGINLTAAKSTANQELRFVLEIISNKENKQTHLYPFGPALNRVVVPGGGAC